MSKETFRERVAEVAKTASLIIAAAGVLIESAPAVFFGGFGFFAADRAKQQLATSN